MAEGNTTTETSHKGLRSFIDRAKQIKQIRNRGNKDAVLRAKIEQTSEEGEIDILTGLPNRRGYERRLAEEIQRSQRTHLKTTVVSLDLDKLKAINDSNGHAAGDDHIRKAADAFRKGLRTTDYIARVGGDEFAVIMPNTDLKQVRELWNERLKPITEGEGIAVSAGAAEFDHEEPTKSIEFADHAMYGAKREQKKNGNTLMVKEPQKV